MNAVVVLGALAIVGAVTAFWWGMSAKPSPARAHLFTDLPEPEARVHASATTAALPRSPGAPAVSSAVKRASADRQAARSSGVPRLQAPACTADRPRARTHLIRRDRNAGAGADASGSV